MSHKDPNLCYKIYIISYDIDLCHIKIKAAARTSYELASPIIDSTLRIGQAMPDAGGLVVDSDGA